MPDEPISEEPKHIVSKAPEVEYTNVARFYANHVQLNMSLFEVRLVMNFIHGVNSENNHLMAMETMFISMSPELARATYNILGRALEAYQRQYGNLRFPIGTEAVVGMDINEAVKRALDMTDAPHADKK